MAYEFYWLINSRDGAQTHKLQSLTPIEVWQQMRGSETDAAARSGIVHDQEVACRSLRPH